MSSESLLDLFTAYGYGIFDGLGCLLWAGCFILVGYCAGGHLGEVHERVRTILAAGLAGLGAAWLIIRLTRHPGSGRA